MNTTNSDLPTYKSTYKTEEGKTAVLSAYENILKNWQVPYKEAFIMTGYGSTYMIQYGNEANPPLLLLHGTSSNSAMWIGDIELYAKHYLVYAIDIPGEPGKSEDKEYSLNSTIYYEWLQEVVTQLGLRKFTLAAISLGAWLAVGYASRYPQNVEKLVLLCPSGIGAEKASFLLKAIFYMFQGERGYDKLVNQINGGQDIPEKVKEYTKLIAKNFNLRTEHVPVYKDEEISRLQMPVLLYVGEKDVLLKSKETAKRIRKLLPHAKVNYLKDYGHVLTGFKEEILEFLLS